MIKNVDAIPDWSSAPPLHELVGHLNTEAKALLYLATPISDGYISLDHTRDKLDELNAFNIERRRDRFCVHGIAKTMGGVLLDTTRISKDPEEVVAGVNESLIRKSTGRRTAIATAVAGSILENSVTCSYSMRILFGEHIGKTTQPGKSAWTHPVLTRLTILEELLRAHDSVTDSFTRTDIKDAVSERLGVTSDCVGVHLRRLVDGNILQATSRTGIQFSPGVDTTIGPEAVTRSIMTALRAIEAGSDEQIAQATHAAEQIMQRPYRVPILVRKSYASTNHTGK